MRAVCCLSDIMMVLDDLRTMHHKQTQWLRQVRTGVFRGAV